MESWPYGLAEVENDDHEIDAGENTMRTQFSDGFVQQKRLATKALKIRRFNVAVAIENVAAFREWVESYGGDWFDFTDPEDGASRQCRIQGGRIPLRRADDRMLPGFRKYYRGLAVLESY